jgi:hypothetical protein
MFSSYWCTAIFAKSHSLHYILKKQRKSISNNDDTEEGTTLSEETTLGTLLIRKSRERRFKKTTCRNDGLKKQNQRNDAHSDSEEKEI